VESRPTAVIINHGCRLNQYEGEALAYALSRAGIRVIEIDEGLRPDIVVVNTCTVTVKSDRKSRNSIHRGRAALAEGGLLIVTGCYAETNHDRLAEIEGVHLVIGRNGKSSIPDIVRTHLQGISGNIRYRTSPFDYADIDRPSRSRAYIKVQDGCSMRCTYCKVPLARGNGRSRDDGDVVLSAVRLARQGYGEAVLTGINLGSYRYGGKNLAGLITDILTATPEDFMIRLSSIEPNYFTEDLFSVINSGRVQPHFHIPLQSGSDRILRLMNRPYTAGKYEAVAERIRAVKPDLHIAADIIVGFPSEEEKDFEATLALVERVGCASAHVFSYSPRENTAASRMEDDVPAAVKKERSMKAASCSGELNFSFRKRYEGKLLDAILESGRGGLSGVTGNYIKVSLHGTGKDLCGKRLPIRITSVSRSETRGERA